MAYVNDQQGYGEPSESWVSATIDAAADWIAGLFGGQAEERDRRRFAQNEAAFRAAANGGEWDLAFLRARTGEYGETDIPVQLQYAVSPSNGSPETPGRIGGWATGPARRHAAVLLDGLDSWSGDPGTWPEVDPSTLQELYDLARQEGRDAAEAALQALAAAAYGALPDEYRAAVERGIRDHYLGSRPVQTAGIGVLLAGGLAVAMLTSKRRR